MKCLLIAVTSCALICSCSPLAMRAEMPLNTEKAPQGIRSEDPQKRCEAMQQLYARGVESYPQLYEMLLDDTPYEMVCGPAATDFHSLEFIIESDPTHNELAVVENCVLNDVSMTTAHVAAFLVIAIEGRNLYFAEYCVSQIESESFFDDLRDQMREDNFQRMGCDLYDVLWVHGIWIREC